MAAPPPSDPPFPTILILILSWFNCCLCSSGSRVSFPYPFVHNMYYVVVCFVCVLVASGVSEYITQMLSTSLAQGINSYIAALVMPATTIKAMRQKQTKSHLLQRVTAMASLRALLCSTPQTTITYI